MDAFIRDIDGLKGAILGGKFVGQINELVIFLKNGLYYQSTGNVPGALVSYSNAETYVHFFLSMPAELVLDPTHKTMLEQLEQELLGYIEVLQEKTRALVRTGGSGKKEDKEEWQEVCSTVTPKLMTGSDAITFADVIGMNKEKELMITSFVKPLLMPNLFPALSKGILLYGMPGTGKTYIAKAAIKELQAYDPSIQVIFFDPTGADLKGKYVGETEKKITKYFTCAARAACAAMEQSIKSGNPTKYISIIFIDEFDSIAGDRSKDDTGIMANSVNTILQMMDGVQSFKNVAVMAASNYPWKLDAAVLRRFTNQVNVTVPKFEDIKELIKFEFKKNIQIKKFDYWCYCKDEIKDEVYDAKNLMDAMCSAGFSVKENASIIDGPGGKKQIRVCLPSDFKYADKTSVSRNIRVSATPRPDGNGTDVIIVMHGENYELLRYTFFVKGKLSTRAEIVIEPSESLSAASVAPVASVGRPKAEGGSRNKSFRYNRNKSQKYTRKQGRIQDYEAEPVRQEGGAKCDVSVLLTEDGDWLKDAKGVSSIFSLVTASTKTKDIEKYAPYKFFKSEFLSSSILTEYAQKMYEAKYSNSDISNVMTNIAQETGKKAVANGMYVNYGKVFDKLRITSIKEEERGPLSKYWVSVLSTFSDTAALQKLRTDIIEKLITAEKTIDLHEYVCSTDYTAGKALTCVPHYGGKYINAKFIPGIPLLAIVNDASIDDVYLDKNFVEKVQSISDYIRTVPTDPISEKKSKMLPIMIRKRMILTNLPDDGNYSPLNNPYTFMKNIYSQLYDADQDMKNTELTLEEMVDIALKACYMYDEEVKYYEDRIKDLKGHDHVGKTEGAIIDAKGNISGEDFTQLSTIFQSYVNLVWYMQKVIDQMTTDQATKQEFLTEYEELSHSQFDIMIKKYNILNRSTDDVTIVRLKASINSNIRSIIRTYMVCLVRIATGTQTTPPVYKTFEEANEYRAKNPSLIIPPLEYAEKEIDVYLAATIDPLSPSWKLASATGSYTTKLFQYVAESTQWARSIGSYIGSFFSGTTPAAVSGNAALSSLSAYMSEQKDVSALNYIISRTHSIGFSDPTDDSGNVRWVSIKAYTGAPKSKNPLPAIGNMLNIVDHYRTLKAAFYNTEMTSKEAGNVSPAHLSLARLLEKGTFNIPYATFETLSARDFPIAVLNGVFDAIWAESTQYGLGISQFGFTEKGPAAVGVAKYKDLVVTTDVDKSLLVNFDMLPGLFKGALKAFPSTYNPVLGGHIAEYEANRAKFLEDIASGAKKI